MKQIFSSKASKGIAGIGLLSVVGTLVGVASASRSAPEVDFTAAGVAFVKGEMMVKVKNKAALERFVSDKQESFGALAVRTAVSTNNDGTSWYKVKMNEDVSIKESIAEAQASDGIEYAEPNYIYSINIGAPKPKPTPTPKPGKGGPDYQTAPEMPNPPVVDPDLSKLYGLNKIDAEDAWKITKGSKSVIVADIDTGADYNHPDLINNFWLNTKEIPGDGKDNDNNGQIDDLIGYDFRDKDARPFDDNQHGSHTTGTIAATGGNGVGISGVAQNASVMSLRFLGGSQGSGTGEDAILAIDYATKNGAHIMSNSWGGGGFSQALFDSISRANDKGILFVAAAGNDGNDNDETPSYPATYNLPNIVSVAATDSNDGLASFSCFGLKSVHLAAPGVKVYSTVPGGKYAAFSGTSMATPHVAGAAVLLKAAYPNLKAAELKKLLLDSVEKLSSLDGKVSTGGRLNIAKALDLAKSKFGAPASN